MRLASLLKRKGGIIPNVFHSAHGRRALVSTLDWPFRKGFSYKHNNLTEALVMAKAFQELAYDVDIINYDSDLEFDYGAYNVVFGFGNPLEKLFLKEARRRPRAILYCNSQHVPTLTALSMQRLEDVYRKRGVWLPASARIGRGGIAEGAADGLLVLGNEIVADSFRHLTRNPIHSLPLCFLKTVEAGPILAERPLDEARRHFIWFAGSGLVHKGLDLVLEAIAAHPDLHLHVYGDFRREAGFVQAYHHELFECPNIHVEGFLAIESPAFPAALTRSAFMICPSCSEGSCSSVLNICGNGGLVPIITAQCGIDIGDFGILVGSTTVQAVEAALFEAGGLGLDELDRRQRASAAHFQNVHSLERFQERMTWSIQDILGRPQ